MQSRWISWVVVGFLLPTSLVQAQTLPAQENALRGLDGLRVEVTLAGAAEDVGVTETALRDAVEGRLRQAGLGGVRPADDRAVRGDPRLLVTVHTISVTGGYAFMVSVQFIERVVRLPARCTAEARVPDADGRHRPRRQSNHRTSPSAFLIH